MYIHTLYTNDVYIYNIYIYIYISKKPTLLYVTAVDIKESHSFPCRCILEHIYTIWTWLRGSKLVKNKNIPD